MTPYAYVERHALALLGALAAGFLLLHAVGWSATAVVLSGLDAWHVPRLQSVLLAALALITLRGASAQRRTRVVLVSGVLVVAVVFFVVAPLPREFQGHGLMPGGEDTASSRREFETRFRVEEGIVHLHSPLGDLLMVGLDAAFGASDASPARAYATFSRLAGIVFLLELVLVAVWHRWSRRSCRYVGLAMAMPFTLLFFGYWELGYAAMAVAVIPLLVPRARTGGRRERGSILAGCLRGLHAAVHGVGALGLASGVLYLLADVRAHVKQRMVTALAFAGAAVAVFSACLAMALARGSSLVWEREIGGRPLLDTEVIDHRLAKPLLSLTGLGEFGLFSVLAGVPLLALVMLTARASIRTQVAACALPSLWFLIQWWPVSAPFNLDLLLSVFPGMCAACWAMADTHRSAVRAWFVLVGIHAVLWTALGNALFARSWVGA